LKILFFANIDWYLYNFRLPLAQALRTEDIEVVMLSPPGDYGNRLQAEGFRWVPLPMNPRSLNPWKEAKLLFYLTRLYAQEKPDLIHHFSIKCVVYGSLAAQLVGIRARVNAITGMGHVFISNSWRARLLCPVVRHLLKVALAGAYNRVIVQNPDDRGVLIKAGLIAPERVHLIPGSGVNTQRFTPHCKTTPSTEPTMTKAIMPVCRVLLAARLLWEKGIGEYVQAARLLKEKGLPVQFFLAGSPDTKNPTSVSTERISEWQQGGYVKLLGHVDAMEQLMSQIDIGVLPSYREGLPRSLLEAAACGLPIVTTDVPGCREVVTHGINGLLVPPRDPEALANAIEYLVKNPEERQRMGKAGRARVLAEFDERIVLQKTIAVYRELLNARRF